MRTHVENCKPGSVRFDVITVGHPTLLIAPAQSREQEQANQEISESMAMPNNNFRGKVSG